MASNMQQNIVTMTLIEDWIRSDTNPFMALLARKKQHNHDKSGAINKDNSKTIFPWSLSGRLTFVTLSILA